MRLRRLPLVLAFVLAAGLAGPPAHAQSDAAQIASAKQAFKEGDEAEKRRDLATAAAKFKEALAIKETPQIILRLGGVEEKMGRLAQAMASYERGMQKAEAQKLANVAKVAREQMEAMRARVPTVVVTVAKTYPELQVTLDDKPLALGTKIFLDPGDHKIVAEATGYQKKEKPFSAVERDSLEFQLDLAPAGGPAPIAGPVDATPVDAGGKSGSKLPAVVLIAAGGAAVVGGVVFFVVSVGKNSDIDKQCGGDRDHCKVPASKQDEIKSEVSQANLFQVLAGVSAGVGAAGIGIGTYLLLKKPPGAAQPAAGAVRVTPWVGPTTAGLGLSGAF